MTRALFSYIYIFVFSLHAQVLTLKECIDGSLKNYPDVKISFLNASQSKYALNIAKADYLPQININANYNPISTFALPQNGRFNTVEEKSYSINATVNQKIYDFSKTFSIVEAYKKDSEIADLTLKDTRSLLIFNVKKLYDSAFLQKQTLKVLKKDLDAKEELYKQALALVKEGLKTQADALSIQSSLNLAKEDLAAAKARLKKALYTLSLYIGKNIDTDIVILEDTKSTIKKEYPLFEDISRDNPLLRGLEKGIERDSLLYQASISENYGSMDISASYTHQNSINEYDTSLVGITYTLPLYSGNRISSQTQKALVEKQKAKERYNLKKLLIKDEFESLMIDLKKYEYTIEAKKSIIISSGAAKKIVEARYKEGLCTYIEVLDSLSSYLHAKLGLLESEFAQKSIINEIEYLQGHVK